MLDASRPSVLSGFARMVCTLCGLTLLACGSGTTNADLGPATCKLGDACATDGDCPAVACISDDGNITINVSAHACVLGQCVADTCACSVDAKVCCYPSLGANPADFNGTWKGTTSQNSPVEFTISSGSLTELKLSWIMDDCQTPPDFEPKTVTGSSTFTVPPGAAPIDKYGEIPWWHSWDSDPALQNPVPSMTPQETSTSTAVSTAPAPQNASLSVSISFASTHKASGTIVGLMLTSDSPYDCIGMVDNITFTATR